MVSSQYDLISVSEIILVIVISIVTSIFTIYHFIWKRGFCQSQLENRITHLEEWKEEHLKDYRDLLAENNSRRIENEELRKQLSKMDSKLSYISGKIDQALKKDSEQSE